MSTTAQYSPRILRVGACVVPLNVRLVVGILITLAITVLVAVWALTQGSYSLTMGQVAAVFTGSGTHIQRTVVLEMRLGRVLVAIVVGAALGYAGALTQNVARNALASPDILGITQGASLAAASTIIFAGAGTGGIVEASASGLMSMVGVPGAAILGAVITALVVWLVSGAPKSSMIHVVLIGVAASIFLSAATTWILAYAQLDRAASARMWLTGSLNGRDFNHLWIPLAVVLCAVAAAGWIAFQLAALTLGETTATVLGLRVRRVQLVHLLTAVVLTAVAVAATGPIGFIAFVCPHLARLLANTPAPPLLFSAVLGGCVLLIADQVARIVLPWELPVGVVTSVVGAPFLLYMIIRTRRLESI